MGDFGVFVKARFDKRWQLRIQCLPQAQNSSENADPGFRIMLDIKLIRANPEWVKERLAARLADPGAVDAVFTVCPVAIRHGRGGGVAAQLNRDSKSIGQLMRDGRARRPRRSRRATENSATGSRFCGKKSGGSMPSGTNSCSTSPTCP